jgi:hypothetical protein
MFLILLEVRRNANEGKGMLPSSPDWHEYTPNELMQLGNLCDKLEALWFTTTTKKPPSLPKQSGVEASPATDPSAGTSAAARQSGVEASSASGSTAGKPTPATECKTDLEAFQEAALVGCKLHLMETRTAKTIDLEKCLCAVRQAIRDKYANADKKLVLKMDLF